MLASTVVAQNKFGVYTELAQGVTLFPRDGLFLDSDFNLGVQFNTSKGVFTPYGKYRFGGLMSGDFAPFEMRYSALGLGFKYRIFSSEKKVSPFVRLESLTEIKTRIGTSDFEIFELHNYFYTPFFGSLYLGMDFNLIKNFNINFALGGDLRSMRAYFNPPEYETVIFQGFSAQLGLSYAFSVGKRNNE